MTKKIILFLVEGPTDEDALALVYSKLVREHDLEFDVLHTDITAGEDMIHMAEIFKRVCMPGLLPGERKSVEYKYPALFLNLCHIEIDGALVRRV